MIRDPSPQERTPPDAETVDVRRVTLKGSDSRAEPGFPGPGRVFGDFELLEEIGRGGMGAVYKARQKSLDRVVALKLILPALVTSDEHAEHFRAEARAAAKVRHVNCVGVFEVGEIDGQHYIAMEYVEGRDLSRLVEDAPMEPEAAALTVYRLARAVAHLHSHGIVHRDLKPTNIIVDAEGEPHVTDFGVAKFSTQRERDGDSTPLIVGTPRYMSPEQAAGRDRVVGPLSDVYSLGAILYELLCGRPPFVTESPMETLVHVVERDPDLPSVHRPEIPRALELICLKCLDKGRHRRYRTADALAADLQRFLAGDVVEAQPLTAGKRFRRWMRRQPALAWRLLPMGVFFLVELAWYHVFHFVDRLFHTRVLAFLAVWAAVSVFFQGWVRSRYLPTPALYSWAAADSLCLTGIVWSSQNASTPLVSCYFLLIVASAFWYRVALVWFVTGVAMCSYLAFALMSRAWPEEFRRTVDVHAIVMISLLVLGFMVAHQVRRTRRLSRYYRHAVR